ncbi:MAG: hypothetical protein HY786_04820, partial [Deltaproteobacteria bacterium]|nr:hypothetical protein [Deltaproteobacteria bacterium]
AEEADELMREVEGLKERLNAIESSGKRTDTKGRALIDELEQKIDNFIDIGGYMDMEYIASDKSNFKDGFRVHHFSLLIKKQVAEGWSIFSELEFEDAPYFEDVKKEGKIFVENMYGDAEITDYLTFRFGRYLAPAGIWNIDHYPPFVPTQERPQHIRKIFPQYVDGVQFFGGMNSGALSYNYSLYTGNGFSEAGSGDSNESKDVGARIVFKLPYLTDLEAGVSGYTGKDKDKDDTEREAYGGDLKFSINSLKIQGEYAAAGLKKGSAKYYRTGWYTQFIYDIGSSSFIYRYDWYEEDSRKSETTVNVFAYNYHFTPEIVGKLEYHLFDEPAEDYYKAIGSIAIYFGN